MKGWEDLVEMIDGFAASLERWVNWVLTGAGIAAAVAGVIGIWVLAH